MIDYKCPKCKESMSSPNSLAGQEDVCPICGCTAVVPQGEAEVPKNVALIGNIDAICPCCGSELEKKPGKKKKCPHCGQFMYVRTRPSDKQQVLVTQAQADQIEEQWSIVNGTHEAFLAEKKRFAETKIVLTNRFSQTPSDNDVRWGLLNQELLEHMKQRNWGLFRNTKFGMAELLRKENRLTEALGFYLEVCYLDLNGPRNVGGQTDARLLREFPPWNSNGPSVFLAPGVLDRITRIIQKGGLASDVVEEIYQKNTSALCKSLRLPLSPATAWPKIKEAAFGK